MIQKFVSTGVAIDEEDEKMKDDDGDCDCDGQVYGEVYDGDPYNDDEYNDYNNDYGNDDLDGDEDSNIACSASSGSGSACGTAFVVPEPGQSKFYCEEAIASQMNKVIRSTKIPDSDVAMLLLISTHWNVDSCQYLYWDNEDESLNKIGLSGYNPNLIQSRLHATGTGNAGRNIDAMYVFARWINRKLLR